MNLTNYELCAGYLEKTVIPYLRLYCSLDEEHLLHNAGDNFAWISLDEPKDFEDIKGYKGITVSVGEDVNPNIEPLKNPPTISVSIMSSDGQNMKNFLCYSLDDLIKGMNDLYITNYELCAGYLEKTLLPYLRLHCNLDAEHLQHKDGRNCAWISLDAPKDFEDITGYEGISISVSEAANPNIRFNKPPTISGMILGDDGYYKEFCWNSLDDVVKGINDLK